MRSLGGLVKNFSIWDVGGHRCAALEPATSMYLIIFFVYLLYGWINNEERPRD